MSVSVGAGDDDVVAVMADRGGDRAVFQAEVFQQAVGHIAVRLAVALDDGDEAEAMVVEMGPQSLPEQGRRCRGRA
jgi:electron transfer flavoprotein alpha/beta subunit